MASIETIQAIGGYGAQPIVVGGLAHFEISDKRDKWNAHKQHGTKEFTVKVVNEIVALPEYIEDKKLLIEVLRKIWNAPIGDILFAIAKSTEIIEPMVVAHRTLFWKLKELIETVVILYLKHVHGCPVKAELSKWKKYVHKHNIDTSSIILWMLFGHKSELKPPKIKEHKLIAAIKFDYLGYCPNVPNERIAKLLTFPVDKLLEQISNKINIPITFTKITKLLKENSLEVISPKIDCKKPTIKKAKYSSDYLHNFMEAWLELNDCLKPTLISLEIQYVNNAKQIDKVSREIDEINGKLLKYI